MLFPQEINCQQGPSFERDESLVPCKKIKRGVMFSSQATVIYVKPCHEISKREKSNLWYGSDEMGCFRKTARMEAKSAKLPTGATVVKEHCSQFARDLYRKSLENPNLDFSELHGDSTGMRCQESIDYRLKMRGLESRINVERLRNKYYTIQAVMEAQRRLRRKATRRRMLSKQGEMCKVDNNKCAAMLANVSRKFSRWAREIALHAGSKDFYAVRPDRFTIPLPINFSISSCNENNLVKVTFENDKARASKTRNMFLCECFDNNVEITRCENRITSPVRSLVLSN